MKKFLLVAFVLSCFVTNAQVRRVGILGSSTANGQGVPVDSSWAQRLRNNYRPLAIIDTIQKVAASTYDCYSGMPTGYVAPAGRNQPNVNYNITRLMSRVPAPTTVIINYPTTNYNVFSDQEILFCLDSIRKYANLFGAKVYITTTQPRDNFNDAGRARLKYLNGLIQEYFGVDSTIDFYTVLHNPANNRLKPEFVLQGDAVHTNSRGQDSLFQQVLRKNIFGIDFRSIERVLVDVGETNTVTGRGRTGDYWNNLTDTRKGAVADSLVNTRNKPVGIKLEVINAGGPVATTNTGVASGGPVGGVDEYPPTATTDHAVFVPAITNGKWKISGLDPARSYTIRFWGSSTASGYRFTQVKRSDENSWQEYLATNNRNYQSAATFAFSGQTEMSFDIRAKMNNIAGIVSIVDIVSTLPSIKRNLPPVANAGKDTTLVLPADSIRLDASASVDPEGAPLQYRWNWIAGPPGAKLSSYVTASPMLRELKEGTYRLWMQVTDNGGLTHRDTITIVVKPQRILVPNIGPRAKATAESQRFMLPKNFVMLDGSASDDEDGSISAYRWRQLDGPTTAIFSDSLAALATASGLAEGNYLFELQVTDDSLATATDTLQVELLRARYIPVARAGADQQIKLPVNTITLDGSLSADSTGSLTSYRWRKTSGPVTFTITDSLAAVTTVTGVVAGIYEFELQVTDDDGDTSVDSVLVRVLPQDPAPGSIKRVLVDFGLAASTTPSPPGGLYWNNVTDARKGVRLTDAIATDNTSTGIKMEVVNPLGTAGAFDLNTRTSNTVGVVGDYPATATTDNAFIHTSISNGQWRISGLDPAQQYTIRFWGSIAMSGSRVAQIHAEGETTWKEYNASFNTNPANAAVFTVTGKTEQVFDIRVKAGSTFSYINVLDITIGATAPATASMPSRKDAGPDADVTSADRIAPNPAKGITQLSLDNEYKGMLTIRLLNSSGQELRQWRVAKAARRLVQPLDLGKGPQGVYFIEVQMGGSKKVYRVVKE